MGEWAGMTSVSLPVGRPLRRNLMCFVPPMTAKPKPSRMLTTSAPERTLSPPRIRWLRNLVICQDRRRSVESEGSRIVALKIQGDRIADVFLQLLEVRALRDDRSIHAASSVDAVFERNVKLNYRFHMRSLPWLRQVSINALIVRSVEILN